jgi:hypothetical protein
MEKVNIILTCGGKLHRAGCIVIDYKTRSITRDGKIVTFGLKKLFNYRFKLSAAIVAAMPGHVPWSSLTNILYDEREDGGPLSAPDNVRTYAWRVKEELKYIDIGLHVEFGRGIYAYDMLGRVVAATRECVSLRTLKIRKKKFLLRQIANRAQK